MNTTTRLMRSRNDRMIAGVAAGIARYLIIDTAIVRLIFVLLALSGPAFLLYPLLWLIMPQEPAEGAGVSQVFVATGKTQRLRVDAMTGETGGPEQEVPINNVGGGRPHHESQPATPGNRMLGYMLLGLGVFIILQIIWPGFTWIVFPASLVAVGIYLLRK
ncbi:PspC domain-containing protein [Candidatus Chloroploca sp. M-50]|uniref:PspC domain-containing protein n=1 Tax=Candidatus Chloroploca mongolica TaxID=2528176 RepID=A0ABS4DBH1_9CHLR|nr:PspC domain-containing protein [Candidatus Chloroploca mongolica]MBP1466634.1 PspC domain-containing protein [Candidatus Chloroploca mongolica]